MRSSTPRYGGTLDILNPTVSDMKIACEEIERAVAKTATENPHLDPQTLRTWFQASQDFERGNLLIRIYWSALDKRSGK